MKEKRFDIRCYFDIAPGGLAPFTLQISKDTLTISAHVRGAKEPLPSSLRMIKSIDDFLHKATPHEPSEECEQPEKIVFFLRWVPK